MHKITLPKKTKKHRFSAPMNKKVLRLSQARLDLNGKEICVQNFYIPDYGRIVKITKLTHLN